MFNIQIAGVDNSGYAVNSQNQRIVIEHNGNYSALKQDEFNPEKFVLVEIDID